MKLKLMLKKLTWIVHGRSELDDCNYREHDDEEMTDKIFGEIIAIAHLTTRLQISMTNEQVL